MEELIIQGWGPIVPGCRWLLEPQPSSDQAMGVGFPHHVERFRPGGSPFYSPADRSR